MPTRTSAIWSRTRQQAAACAFACSLLGVPSLAIAAPSAAEKETARTLMDEGDKFVAAGQLAQALERYRAAHQLVGVPTTGIELAKTESALGMLVEARATALSVVRMPVEPGEPAVFAAARTKAEALAEELASRIPALVITVVPAEAPATVTIDDVALPSAALGLPYKVNPGKHKVSASAAGFEPTTAEVQLQEGGQQSVTLRLVQSAAAVTPVPTPATAEAPAAPMDSAPPTEGSGNTLAYVALGVAGVGATVGAISGVMSLGKKSDAEKFCHGNVCSRDAEKSIDESKSLATVANIGFGVAIVAGVFGVWQLVSSDSPAETAATGSKAGPFRVSVNPLATPSAAGLSFSGATLDLKGEL